MAQQWLQVVIPITPETREILSDFLLGIGAAWVSVEGEKLLSYFPLSSDQEDLARDIRESLKTLQDSGVDTKVEEPIIREVSDEGWAERWTEFFKPLKISHRLVVSPPWEMYDPDPGEEVLLIDPGMGFGTGGHETTRACLKSIDEIMEEGFRVLDVGTGSGILSIAAAILGAENITALDVDPAALQNARHNATLNDCIGKILFEERSIQPGDRGFDLVVANIFAETIVELAGLLKEATLPGGYLILSGIMTPRASIVEDAMADLELMERLAEGNWTTLVYRKAVPVQ